MASRKQESAEVEIAEVVNAELVPVTTRKNDFISQYLTEEAEDTTLPEGAGYEAILQKIMRASSEEELWSESQADKPEDVYRRKLTVRGYSVIDSDFPEGPKVYFAVDAHDEIDDIDRVILTGNQKIMAKLLAAHQRGWFPAKVMFIQSTKVNKYGRFIEDLVKWSD